ncbi:MAG: type II toxin-antitoxin system VapC family toxin [Desulfobacteraceae bacterium]|nr:MAG: type II toxin-antitoxin system VapC family toxin [Desulfobacteraceae bacterium]
MLLDTCALLWLVHDQSHFTEETLANLDESPVVFICAVSGFEIGLKHRAGKLTLPAPPRQWISEILTHHRIDVIGMDLEICIQAAELPPIHRDPCDRFIIAAALVRGLPVVTADRRFAEYGVKILI